MSNDITAYNIGALVVINLDTNTLFLDLINDLPRDAFDALPTDGQPFSIRHHPIASNNSTEFWCKDVDLSKFRIVVLHAYTEEPPTGEKP